MRRQRLSLARRSERGQSLIETALILPVLLLLTFNAINFGYFFFVAVNLAAAPRSGVQYSILGWSTPSQLTQAQAGPASPPCPTAVTNPSLYVCTLTYHDMAGVLSSYSNATVQVCSSTVGVLNPGTNTMRSDCIKYGSAAATYTPAPDPEAPLFILDRVDVVYTLTPIIPAFQLPTPGGPISLSLLPSLTMHRQVSMREMN
jgi:hypothetical protein